MEYEIETGWRRSKGGIMLIRRKTSIKIQQQPDGDYLRTRHTKIFDMDRPILAAI